MDGFFDEPGDGSDYDPSMDGDDLQNLSDREGWEDGQAEMREGDEHDGDECDHEDGDGSDFVPGDEPGDEDAGLDERYEGYYGDE